MPATARKLYYGQDVISGDLAYELDREVRERELRHAGEARREREASPAPKVRSVSHELPRQRQRVSAVSVLGFAAAVGLAVLVLLSYVRLTTISTSVVELKGQLSALKTEHVTLTAQYQQIYDLTSVKEAAEAAGMAKPSASQIYYLELPNGDSAVVYRQEEPGLLHRILTSLHHGIYAVTEYLN